MKVSTFAAAFGAAATLFSAGAASAAPTDNVLYAAAGSSALYNVFLKAAISVTGGTASSVNVSSGAFVVDHTAAGSPAAANEKGNIWIVWNNLAGDPNPSSGTRNIYYYVSVDSTVGDRAFYKSDGVSVITSNAGFSSVPPDVIAAVNASTINAGMTDIRPEDALVATQRAYGFGYSTSNPIMDGAGQTATPVAFSLSARPSLTTSIGASPIVVFVNKTTSAGTNTPVLAGVTDISSTNLSKTLDGILAGSTATLALGTTAPLTTFIREPLSGTYNTTEFCEPHSQEFNTTQENGVDSTPNSAGGFQNPLNDAGVPLAAASTGNADLVTDGGASSGGGRVRAIGTGALIRGVNSCANAIGYAFWSVGNFASSKAGNTKYLTVDGVDPLVDTYAGGAYPSGANTTFSHIKDGTYRTWSVLRIVTDLQESSAIGTLVNNAVGQDAGGDFIGASSLKVFRSHRSVAVNATGPDGGKITDAVASPSNGRAGEPAEAGSDVGGTVYSDTLETANGGQLLNTRF